MGYFGYNYNKKNRTIRVRALKLVKIANGLYINPSHVVRAYTGDAWSETQKQTVPYTHVVLSDGKTELTGLSLEALAEILNQKEEKQ